MFLIFLQPYVLKRREKWVTLYFGQNTVVVDHVEIYVLLKFLIHTLL